MKKFFKILKIILCVVLVVLIFGIALTKCSCNKKGNEIAVAYAESIPLQERTIYSKHISFNNNISTYSYYNLSGSSSLQDSNGIIAVLRITELPSLKITIEVVNNLYEDIAGGIQFYNAGHFVSSHRITQWNIQTGYYTFNYDTALYDELRVVILNKNAVENPQTDYKFKTNLYFYAGEYTPGFQQGFQAGLEQGKQEGANIAEYGVFQNATVDATFIYEDNTKITANNLTPQFIYNGIYLNSIAKKYETNGDENYLENADITINFEIPFTYSNDYPIVKQGDTDNLDFILTDTKGEKWYGEFLYSNTEVKGSSYIKDTLNIAPIVSMTINFGRAADTLSSVQIFQMNGGFRAGYTSGFNIGLSQGREEGQKTGFTSGYDKGVIDGKEEGYANAIAEGVSQMGLFNGLLAFIRVFFQLLTQFFETKIVGDITLGLLVIGLPAAFMIINLAIGLVKKLLGARGASEGDNG